MEHHFPRCAFAGRRSSHPRWTSAPHPPNRLEPQTVSTGVFFCPQAKLMRARPTPCVESCFSHCVLSASSSTWCVPAVQKPRDEWSPAFPVWCWRRPRNKRRRTHSSLSRDGCGHSSSAVLATCSELRSMLVWFRRPTAKLWGRVSVGRRSVVAPARSLACSELRSMLVWFWRPQAKPWGSRPSRSPGGCGPSSRGAARSAGPPRRRSWEGRGDVPV